MLGPRSGKRTVKVHFPSGGQSKDSNLTPPPTTTTTKREVTIKPNLATRILDGLLWRRVQHDTDQLQPRQLDRLLIFISGKLKGGGKGLRNVLLGVHHVVGDIERA